MLENPFLYNHDRGWLLHFTGNLASALTPGAFGWDDTASIVPASMVPSYTGSSTYLLITKYNNYKETGGNGINKLAILDPSATMTDPITGNTVMKEVLTIAGVTPDPTLPAVREWCINSAAVDPFTDSILVNSEDGKLYRWNLTSNSFTQVVTLTSGVGEAYTPTVIGKDGTVYAINNATLFAVGIAPPVLGVSIADASISEDGGQTTGTVTRNGSPATALVVTLTSNNTAKATVPATVTIAAGNSSATFPISGVDNNVVDGTQTVTISAAATGFSNGSGTLNVTDDDVTEYASSVVAFSSQYSSTQWSAAQMLGAPDTSTYGDYPTAWTASSKNGTVEQVTLGFATPVYAYGTAIRESNANGFVTQVEVRNAASGAYQTVWTGTDPSAPGSLVDFQVSWTKTTYLVDAVRITVDTNHNLNAYEEIDAVQLQGATVFNGPSLSVSIKDGSISENGGQTTGTVTRSGDTSNALVVNLFSGDTTEASVPATVTIAAGSSSATFPISGVDDDKVDGTRTVSISAAASGFASGSAKLNITDDDLGEYASSVVAFSSQYSSTQWSAAQMLGSPDTVTYGDFPTAWTASSKNGTTEYVTLGFTTSVYAFGTTIRESNANGFVTQVEVRNAASGAYQTVWTGTDSSAPGSLVDFQVSWTKTAYLVDAVRITVDTNHNLNAYEEIDAVQLQGSTVFVGPSLSVSIKDSSISENGGQTTGTVTRNGDTSNPLVVNLFSGDTTEASVPATVTIPAGSSSATFPISGVDDNKVDGTRTVAISAAATGFSTGSAKLDITDDDLGEYASSVVAFSSQYSSTQWSAAQMLGSPDTVTYGDFPTAWTASSKNGTTEYVTLGFATPVYAFGTTIRESNANGFVTQVEVRNATNGAYQTVWTGTDPSAPGSLVDFQVSWTKTAYLVDAVRITVDTNHNLGAWEEIDAVQLQGSTVFVGPSLSVSIKDPSISENGGQTTGTVTRSGDTSNPLVVSLYSGEPTEATVPSTVTIPAGASSATFTITGVDDDKVDGTQTVAITASATGFASGSANLNVTDNDLAEYANSVVAFSSQYSSTQWSAAQMLGAPDTSTYGDFPTAWAASSKNGTIETVTLGFATPVYAFATSIRESNANGFVTQVEVRNAATGVYETVWAGTDPGAPGALADFLVSFAKTAYLVDAVRITVDTNHNLGAWEEIDSVQLQGSK